MDIQTPNVTPTNSQAVLEDLASRYAETKEMERQVKKQLEALKSEILSVTGEDSETVAGAFRIKHSFFTQKRKVPVTYTVEEVKANRFEIKFIGRAAL